MRIMGSNVDNDDKGVNVVTFQRQLYAALSEYLKIGVSDVFKELDDAHERVLLYASVNPN